MNEIISYETTKTILESGVAASVGKKVFGATLDKVGYDISKLYEKGRNAIINKAFKKIDNSDDVKQANLRIARDVLYNGSFCEDEICAEYFGGVLASSRSEDGKDDSKMFYLDLIKSISSFELRLHYIIYQILNNMLVNNDYASKDINVGRESDVVSKEVYFEVSEIVRILGGNDIGSLLHILVSKKLINSFETIKLDSNPIIHYLKVSPSPIGIQLFAVANNKNVHEFPNKNFSNFDDIDLPKQYHKDISLWQNIIK